MKLQLTSGELSQRPCDVAIVPVFALESTPRKSAPLLPELDTLLGGLVATLAKEEDFSGKTEQLLSVPTHRHIAPKRLLLVGLGKRSALTPEGLRLAVGRGIKAAQRLAPSTVELLLPEPIHPDGALEESLRAAVEGALLGLYRFEHYQPSRKEGARGEVRELRFLLPPGAPKSASLQNALVLAERIASSTNLARDLVNEPPNICTPAMLAAAAQKLAKSSKLKCEVLGLDAIKKLNMGMFLGVARGSHEAPALIKLTYTPSGAKAKRAPLALVGKAITFDSGGLSLKPSDSMIDMKTDMAGAAAVLGAMQAIAHLAPAFPVHAYMGACENMPGGGAYKLGEVLTSRLGKTVEITNTDAEGRLVLGDVLAWANEEKPFAIIDLATLTGACMVALGHHIAGAFGSDEALTHEVLGAAEAAGEAMWELPISDLQKDSLKSDIADLKNSGDRWGGAINAAHFLKSFVGETPWVHLDIAGPSTCPRERGYLGRGATGYGVRTLVEYVRRRM